MIAPRWVRACIVVPLAARAVANATLYSVVRDTRKRPVEVHQEFGARLSRTGHEPSTHAGALSVLLSLEDFLEVAKVAAGRPGVTVAELDDGRSPWDVLDELGLRMIRPEEAELEPKPEARGR